MTGGIVNSLWVQKHQTIVGFEPQHPESDSFTSTDALTSAIRALVLFEQQTLSTSLETSEINLEEKRKHGQAKILHKKDIRLH